ncbi:hypothetical protein M2202_009763 [Bradyrhizobium japonicum]|nr:hypothetical protein [Bradyrhizobium japonicum]MCP1794974.1 hypothetical protein [Bradyrhizobium japonicum]MCP1811504.1 hypothetical protein [Bradyrhizobium japonicum]MCP1821773.1 hypothetical protein [Bradyrhizobium japonicum]MCP1876733.1 hypothetical protein [Bradyrhizobium japonicum]
MQRVVRVWPEDQPGKKIEPASMIGQHGGRSAPGVNVAPRKSVGCVEQWGEEGGGAPKHRLFGGNYGMGCSVV